MIAQIEGPDTETGYKVWKLDPLTLVVLSKDEAQQVTYVEYRLKTGWGIGMDTLTTNPFSVDGIRFGDSERMVQALENPDAYASDGSVITGYRCDNRTFAGRAAALHFVFENEGVVRFAYTGNGGAEDFAPFLSEISAQYGAPYVGEDLIALWEIEDGVICALSTSGEGTCVEFFQSQGGGQ